MFLRREKRWGGRWDSNPRRPESQSGALPTELRPPSVVKMKCRPVGDTYGTPGRTRTCYPRLRRPMLYPDELRAQNPFTGSYHSLALTYSAEPEHRRRLRCGKVWSGQRDSNSRHPAPKAGALPDCAMPRFLSPLGTSRQMIRARMPTVNHPAHIPGWAPATAPFPSPTSPCAGHNPPPGHDRSSRR